MDGGHFLVGINQTAAVARHMLDTTSHPAAFKTIKDGAAQRGDLHWFRAKSAIPDHVVRTRLAQVERGVIGHRDAHRRQFQRHRFGSGARGLNRAHRRCGVEPVKRFARWIGRPMRWAKARHASAFLIHGNQKPFAPVDRAQIIGQRAQLVRCLAVATKQNIARRIRLFEKGAFVGGQDRTRTSKYSRRHTRNFAATGSWGKRGNHSKGAKTGGKGCKTGWRQRPSAHPCNDLPPRCV